MRVFISSVIDELREERFAAKNAVVELSKEPLGLSLIPIMFEEFGARSESAREAYVAEVKRADIYLGIIGGEYGRVTDNKKGISATRSEYNEAYRQYQKRRNRFDILIFVKEIDQRELKEKEFWEEIAERHTYSSFKDSRGLRDKVKNDLIKLWIEKFRLPEIRIENILDENKITSFGQKADFFHKEPLWVDFEVGFFVQRKEVNEIINDLKQDNIQSILIKGKPASGKTLLIRNIGYILRKGGWSVFLIRLKRDNLKSYEEELLKINDPRVLIIIDDAHLNLNACENFVRKFSKISQTRLLVSTRRFEEGIKEYSELEKLPRKEIDAVDVFEEIVEKYFKVKYNFTTRRVKRISKNFDKFKADLWTLSYALETYDLERKAVLWSKIFEKIKDDIQHLSVGINEYINAENILLALSCFSKYEIPVKDKFLTEALELREKDIEKLVQVGEIIKVDRWLLGHHSRVAELYLETFHYFEFLGENLKDFLNRNVKKDEYIAFFLRKKKKTLKYCISWRERLLDSYIKRYPKESVPLILKLSNYELFTARAEKREDRIKREMEIKATRKYLIENNFDLIEQQIREEKDLRDVCHCIWEVAKASEQALKLLDIINRRIREEGDIQKISSAINWIWIGDIITWADTGLGTKIIKEFDLEDIKNKVRKERDIVKIAHFISDLSCMDNIAKIRKLLYEMILDNVKEKVERVEDPCTIDTFVSENVDNFDFLSKLIKELEPNNAKSEKVKDKILQLKETWSQD